MLHVQSHIGFDAVTFARRGAQVTAVDFSSVALAKARSLADRCGVEIEWVCTDAIDLPSSLDERFDLGWATMGVLCWIGDVGAWMRAVARALAPGGRLVLIDGQPLRRVLKSDPVRVTRPYGGGARIETAAGSDYATTTRTGPQVQFLYSLGEIVSAVAAAGLRVVQLVEHTELSCDICDTGITREDDGRYRRRVNGHVTPVLFTLIAAVSGVGSLSASGLAAPALPAERDRASRLSSSWSRSWPAHRPTIQPCEARCQQP